MQISSFYTQRKINKILLFILFFFLVSLSIMFLTKTTKKEEKTKLVQPKIEKKSKIVEKKHQAKKKIESKKQNLIIQEKLIDISPHLNYIDFIGEDKYLTDTKPALEIDQIMLNHKEINTFAKDKSLIVEQEDWKIYYEVGLEENAMEEMKNKHSIDLKMFNGKIGFSKSF